MRRIGGAVIKAAARAAPARQSAAPTTSVMFNRLMDYKEQRNGWGGSKANSDQGRRFAAAAAAAGVGGWSAWIWDGDKNQKDGSSPVSVPEGAIAVGPAAADGKLTAVELVQPLEIVIYQYQTCPFCSKVRAYLDYHKLPYTIVEVHPLFKTELKFSKVYKHVPILMLNGMQLNDSTFIIRQLNKFFLEKGAAGFEMPTDDELKWQDWVDQKLVRLITPNIYRTLSESLEVSAYIASAENFSAPSRFIGRYAAGIAMYFVAKKKKKQYNIKNEREDFFTAIDGFVDAKGDKKFMGGNSPNMADLSVFGVLRSLETLSFWKEVTAHTKINQWYGDMKAEVGTSSAKRDSTN